MSERIDFADRLGRIHSAAEALYLACGSPALGADRDQINALTYSANHLVEMIREAEAEFGKLA